MNTRELVETTALISRSSSHLLIEQHRIPDSLLHNYWSRTRQVLHGWNQELQRSMERGSVEAVAVRYLEAVFAANVLNRVWCSVLLASDLQHSQGQAGGIARSVMTAQQQANHTALSYLVNISQSELESLAAVDRFRRKCERWTDLMLGWLVLEYGITDFAHQTERARDFGQEQFGDDGDPVHARVWELLLAGLRLAFPSQPIASEIASGFRNMVHAVLASFPAGTFGGNQTASSSTGSSSNWTPAPPLPPLRPTPHSDFLRKSLFRNSEN